MKAFWIFDFGFSIGRSEWNKIFSLALCTLLLALSLPVQAQQSKKIPRVGYIATRSGPGPSEKAFLQGLQSLGYIEGQTIMIEWRFAQEKFDRLPELASELVQLKVDCHCHLWWQSDCPGG